MQFYQFRNKCMLRYMEYKKQPLTTWAILKASWRLFALCGVVISIFAVLPHPKDAVGIKMFAIGMFFGLMLMNVAQARMVANMTWPVLEEVIDWNLVEDKCSAIENSN